ncbi:hypothetical protein COO91_04199 [Nostoc flagelliforme CCNUN1]|uniref:Uncharacterized protein n=1 Tax=Nostoc flagelliforme CCNUN1 TaxID=2038116 RepID=A0A2K8SRX3_9NOSO|nr:hypothetical protein [Nostoc flagelliforme]AUB38234.1 hypothetical protein COO91_04199 [Nostoc flagelliforme CCNUN1]
MSNIDNLTSTSNDSVVDQEQLFTELTLEEGAVIEGGAIYNLGNKAGVTVNYTINGQNDSLFFNQEKQYYFENSPFVGFDQKIGPGYELVYTPLSSPGNYNFDTSGGYLILTGGDFGPPAANIVAPNPTANSVS